MYVIVRLPKDRRVTSDPWEILTHEFYSGYERDNHNQMVPGFGRVSMSTSQDPLGTSSLVASIQMSWAKAKMQVDTLERDCERYHKEVLEDCTLSIMPLSEVLTALEKCAANKHK